eukprot:scaffold7052_cov42-Attheya_sp.AAC.1
MESYKYDVRTSQASAKVLLTVDRKLSTRNASSPDGWRNLVEKGGLFTSVEQKYLEYVLSAKTMNAKLYLSEAEGVWRVGKKEKVVRHGRLPDE